MQAVKEEIKTYQPTAAVISQSAAYLQPQVVAAAAGSSTSPMAESDAPALSIEVAS